MSIPVIDTLHSMGNFPVTNSSEIQCGEIRLDAALNASAAEISAKYTKPNDGIPKSDLASAVQTSLDKANTALQEHQSLANYVTTTDTRLSNARPASDVYPWAKSSSKPTYTASEVGALPSNTVIPSKTSDIINNSGFITTADISGKADTESVNILSRRVDSVETEQTSLSARMDSFTALGEGSTTGDAELVDGRVAADGTTYENIGGAIRGQITNLNTNLDRKDVSYETVKGSYIGINTSGTPIVKSSDGGPFGMSNIIQINKGDILTFTASGYSTNVSMITQCSAEGELKSVLARSTSSNVETYTYTANSDMYIKLSFNYSKSNKLIINGKKSNTAIFNRLDTEAVVYEKNITNSTFDLNSCIPNRIYLLSVNCVNAPSGVSAAVVYSVAKSSASTSTYPQILITDSNDVYVRFNKYNSGWSSWTKQITTESPALMSSGINVQSTSFDLNNCALNRIYIISVPCVNTPDGFTGGIVYSVAKANNSNDTYAQFLVDVDGKLFTRFKKYGGTWTKWNSSITNEAYKDEYEKSYIKLSLFSKVGVIGDSYASGEIYAPGGALIGDIYRISWIQQLARRNGFTAYNFSEGGLTTRSWLTSGHGLSLLNSTESCKLYILALGINDYYSLGESYLGTTGDMDTEADTFYGNYAKIIRAVKSKNSNAKIMISKCGIRSDASSSSKTLIEKFNVAIENLADKFEIAVIDLTENHYISSSKFANMLINGHPSAVGYSAYATAYEEAISVSMFRNSSYFETADFT